MKKLMIIATVACAAIAANASTLKWGLLSGNLDTEKVDKGTAYLCYYTGSTANWATDLAKLSAYDVTTITGTMGMKLVKVADSSDPTKATADNATFAYSGTGTKVISGQHFITPASFGVESGAASFYYVVIDDGGKDIAYTTTAQTGTMNTGTGNASKLLAANKFSYAAAAAIPEPTSGLLLLLGVAGLALKRKRA